MPKLDSARVDNRLETDGVWMTHPLGYRFRIARSGNDRFMERVRELRQPWLSLIEGGGDIPRGENSRIISEAGADFILVGWEEVLDGAEKPIPYSHEASLKLLTDPQLHDLSEWIWNRSRGMESYRLNGIASAKGN